jgi:FkbM family methyltransferase
MNTTGDEEFCIATNVYGRYSIPKRFRNRPIPKLLLQGGVWEAETVKFLRAKAVAGDVVHAGAFMGDMLPALAQVCQGIVWAFEPNPLNQPAARRTVELNQLTNVRLQGAALGALRGTARLQIEDERGLVHLGTSSMLPSRVASARRTATVEVLPLDEVIPADRQVSLIHLDVEGYEIEALKGAVQILWRCRPLLVLETVPKDRWFMREVLGTLGYQAVRKVDGNTVFEAGLSPPPASPAGLRFFQSARHGLGIHVCHKSGSAAVLQWLHMLEDGVSLAECRRMANFHATSERRFGADPVDWPGTHRVAVVRHPCHRLVSCYFDKIENPANRWVFGRRQASLEDFVSWLEQGNHLDSNSHWRPQSRQIGEHDTLIRLEQWSTGLLELEQKLGLPHFDEAHANTKESVRRYAGDWRRFLTPQLAKRIRRLYAEDFERFGYAEPITGGAA